MSAIVVFGFSGIINLKLPFINAYCQIGFFSLSYRASMIHESILPKIKSGATVRVFEKVKEGDKERLSQFSGMVIARKHGRETGATFTVRTTIAGVGVEKVYPINSPVIEKVEVVNSPKKVFRSKLYYIRNLSRKQTRQKVGSVK